MYWRVGIQQANSTGFPLPILFEALASAMREEEKEDELVDITKRKLGYDLLIWEGIVKYRHLPWNGHKQYFP